MLKLNVGLNRKFGEPNFGSRGGSVHMEVELDNSLMQEPDRLRETVAKLFGMVRQSLDQELTGDSCLPKSAKTVQVEVRPEGKTLQDAISEAGKLITGKQLRYLETLAMNQRRDLATECEREYEARPERLTSRQASSLIEKWRNAPVLVR